MALTHRITKRIELPHEEGQWVEARMPSLDILDKARLSRSRKAIAMMEGINLAAFQGIAAPAQRDDAPEYDWLTLLQACIVAWSYEDPVTPENVAELDGVTVDVVMRALLPVESEAQRKNGSGDSMTPSKVMHLPRKSG